MLKHIPKEMTPDLMKILIEMGHCDELVICDGNFPRFAYPERVVYCMGNDNPQMLNLITEYFPLDNGAEEPVIQMEVSEGDSYVPSTWEKYDEILEKNEGRKVPKKFLDREAFYRRAGNAYAVVVTGETTFYATVILKKGTVGNG